MALVCLLGEGPFSNNLNMLIINSNNLISFVSQVPCTGLAKVCGIMVSG